MMLHGHWLNSRCCLLVHVVAAGVLRLQPCQCAGPITCKTSREACAGQCGGAHTAAGVETRSHMMIATQWLCACPAASAVAAPALTHTAVASKGYAREQHIPEPAIIHLVADADSTSSAPTQAVRVLLLLTFEPPYSCWQPQRRTWLHYSCGQPGGLDNDRMSQTSVHHARAAVARVTWVTCLPAKRCRTLVVNAMGSL